MKPTETRAWDPAEHVLSDEAAAAYVNAAFEDGDPALIAAAIGDVARARGISELAREANLSRESLFRALNGSESPDFGTILKLLKIFGMTLSVTKSEVPLREASPSLQSL